jgi:hypothetical protein
VSSKAVGHVAFLAVAAAVVLAAANWDHIYDEFVEGDSDPRFLSAGRHAGEGEYQGDERELAEFADAGWHRIRIDVMARDSAQGTLVVDGEVRSFTLAPGWESWMSFERRLPGLTGRAYGRRLEIELEAAQIVSNDWMYLYFGDDLDGGRRGFAYARP